MLFGSYIFKKCAFDDSRAGIEDCLKNIPFCLARRICMMAENKNVRYMKLKELRTILKTQKYPKMVVEKGIEKALAIPQEQLGKM